MRSVRAAEPVRRNVRRRLSARRDKESEVLASETGLPEYKRYQADGVAYVPAALFFIGYGTDPAAGSASVPDWTVRLKWRRFLQRRQSCSALPWKLL